MRNATWQVSLLHILLFTIMLFTLIEKATNYWPHGFLSLFDKQPRAVVQYTVLTYINLSTQHTKLPFDAVMHKHLNEFSAESWSPWISSSEDVAAFCVLLLQEPWRQDTN